MHQLPQANVICFQGHCPECLLLEQSRTMVGNYDELLECPQCYLQIHLDGIKDIILRIRGIGEFLPQKTPAIPAHFSPILTRASLLNPLASDGTYFTVEGQLWA